MDELFTHQKFHGLIPSLKILKIHSTVNKIWTTRLSDSTALFPFIEGYESTPTATPAAKMTHILKFTNQEFCTITYRWKGKISYFLFIFPTTGGKEWLNKKKTLIDLISFLKSPEKQEWIRCNEVGSNEIDRMCVHAVFSHQQQYMQQSSHHDTPTYFWSSLPSSDNVVLKWSVAYFS